MAFKTKQQALQLRLSRANVNDRATAHKCAEPNSTPLTKKAAALPQRLFYILVSN